MSYTDDYYKALRTQQQKKKKNALSVQSNEDESGLDSYSQGYYNAIAERNNEREQAIDAIAPITVGSLNHSYSAPSDFFESREKDDDDSGLDFFKKSSLFDDGYDFGDITRTILGTAGDVAVNAGKGLVRMGEGVADWMAHGVANIADWTGNDAYADALRESATESFTDKVFGGVDNYLDQASVLGRTSEAILEGVGQAGAIYATGGALGGLGLGATGTTAATTGFMYLSGVGSGIGEAYQAGATDEEAQIYGRISGFADAVSELLFGGLGKGVNALGVSKGLSSADDMLAKTVSNVFKGRLGKNLAEYGIKAGAEGLEEVIAGSMQALGKKMTYLSEKDLADIIADENLLEQFVVGTFSSGIMQGGDVVTSTRAGRDFITNLTKNEQLVVDTEFNNRLQEATKDGKKLTKKQENELYEEVISDLDKGLISTDTIESVLGGEDYKGYSALAEKETSLTERKNALTKEIDALLDKPNPTIRDNERLAAARQELATVEQSLKGLDVDTARNNLHKTISNLVQNDTRLHESFNERARRGEDLQLDVEKYTGAAKTTAENLLKGGLNNTYKVRSFANMVTKLSADTNVVVDVATAKKLAEAGLGVEGRTVNGVKTKDGIIINVESGKKLETIVGHELTHVFEEAGNYEFAQAIKEYAELKGEYQSRYSELERIYSKKDANGNILKDENGNTIFIRDDVNIDAEVVADLVGDYLFTDTDFINNLSTKHRNVFQKIFDEIKYLLKIATAGSEEARKLEEVKKKFEQAYRENVKGKPDTTDTSTNEEAQEFETDDVQYSISVTDNETLDFLNEQISRGEYDAEKNPNGGYYVTYKSMSFWGYDENGNAILRSPMAEYVDGELSNAYLVPKDKSKLNWYKSTETIDENTGFPTGLLVKTKKPGNKSFSYLPAAENQDLINEDWSNLYFNLKKKVLKKGKWVDSDVPARYNPYEHSSNSMLNDQFSTAYLRDNLVTVKMYVPVSEDNGTFRAKWSKDPTGWADWKTGTVAGKINKQKDLQRRVFLSRYAAPVEIVSDSEVAQAYKSYIEGTDVSIPDNVVSPGLLAELRKAGVPITESGKVQYSLSTETDKAYEDALFNGDTEAAQRMLDKAAKKAGYTKAVYHGTSADFTVFDTDEDSTSREVHPWNADYPDGTIFVAEDESVASYYGQKVMPLYLDTRGMKTFVHKDMPAHRAMDDIRGYEVYNYPVIAVKGSDMTIYATLDNTRLKSAELVTTDDDGVAIPLSQRFNAADPDIRYSLSAETDKSYLDAVNRGDTVTAQKMVDDAAKNAGYTIKAYHGTGYDFTIFDKSKQGDNYKDWGRLGKGFYFAPTSREAETWAELSRGSKNKVMPVYLRSENLLNSFDALPDNLKDTIPADWDSLTKRLAEKYVYNYIEYMQEFGHNVQKILQEKGYDGIDGNVEYVVFEPEQVKSADAVTYDDDGNIIPLSQRFNTAEPDIRFSLSEAVEETKDLVAIHNLNASELLKTLDLGGLPMPSIAVIKAQQGHDQYGDVSLIFPKDTIDPKRNSANKVYGGDAWTPVYPKIEYKANEAISRKVSDKYYELADRIGYDNAKPLYKYVYELGDALNNAGGEAAMLEEIYNDTRVMQVFLEDTGKGKVEPIVTETRTEATASEKEMNQWFIDKLGEDVVRSFKAPSGVSPIAHRKEFMAQYGEQIKQVYRDFFAENFGFDEDSLNNIIANTQPKDFMSFLRKAYVYLDNGGVTIKTETDYEATDNAIREKAKDGYKEWVDSLFKGVEEKTGIRNDLDVFTSSGKRRSWDALHWENTLENVVRAMKAQDQTGADAFAPSSAIFAVAHKNYGSVEEIKADSNRLGRVSEEEYKAMESDYASRLAGIASSIKNPNERNSFIAVDEAAQLIVDAVRNYKTKSGMLRYMQKWNSQVTEETVDDIISLVNDIANMPTGYFEAKPQRAVGLEEVGVFVIPYNTDAKLKQALLDKGYSIAEYNPDVEGDRSRVVNQFEEYKFSLSMPGEISPPYGKHGVYGWEAVKQDPYHPLGPKKFDNDVAPAPNVQTDAWEEYAPMPDNSPEAQLYRAEKAMADIFAQLNADGADPNLQHLTDAEWAERVRVAGEKYDAYAQEAKRLKAEIAEIENQRFANLDDADVPPEVEAGQDYVRDDVSLSATEARGLAQYVRSQLGFHQNKVGKVQDLIAEYGKGNLEPWQLYNELKQNYGKYTEIYRNEDLAEVKKQLRTYGVKVSDAIKREIPDYGYLQKHNFGKIRFSKNGLAVDEAYKEFGEVLPGYFPQNIISPTDQLLRMIEVANMDVETREEHTIDNETISNVVNSIIRGVNDFKYRRKEAYANEFGKASFHQLWMESSKYMPPVDSELQEFTEDNNGQYEMYPAEEKAKPFTRAVLHEQIIGKIKSVFKQKNMDFDEIVNNANRMNALAINDTTPQRVNEKTFGYEAGKVLNDILFNKVALNESAKTKWNNEQVQKIRELSKKYHIKPRSKESQAAQMYAEGFWVNENDEIIPYGNAELAKDFPDVRVQNNIKGLAKDPVVRQMYDETLAQINASRTANAYPEIPRLDNYFLHFRAMNDTFSQLGLPFNPKDIRAKDLPTDLNGVTADNKPGQPFFTSAMHREGKRTSFDLLGGLESYMASAGNQIFHIGDIQNTRAVWGYLADRFGQAHGLENLSSLELEEQAEQIQKVYDGHLSNYARFLNEYANNLAGKTALIDRGVEGLLGRRALQVLNTINTQTGRNQVGYSVSSPLTNFIPAMETIARLPKWDVLKAFAQQATKVFRKDGFAENDPALIRRRGIDKFSRTPYEKISDAGYVLMGAVDNITSEFIVRAKYNELVRKGMDSDLAHIRAGEWAMGVMGDRSLGQVPLMYTSKTLGMLTKYQLEVRNQLDSAFYDTIQEAKASTKDIENATARNAKTAAKITSKLFQIAVLNHIFGQTFEKIAGYNPAFDIISTIATLFGWDDEEDEKEGFGTNLEQAFQEFLGDLPYTSLITDGGRIPMASALPLTQLATGKDKYGNEKSRWETLGEALPYYILPGGYGQLKKTQKGLDMFLGDHPISGSYTDSGNLRFPVEATPWNVLQAGLFGQYASENARDYFDNNRNPLKEKQIQEFIDVDIPIADYWEYREGLAEQDTLEEKFDYIAGLDLPVAKKNILINNIVDREESVDMTDYDDYSSLDEFDFATKKPGKYAIAEAVGGYSSYTKYTEALGDIHADKDENGKSINGSRKEKVQAYIESLPLDYGEKIILHKMEYPADDTYNYDIVEYLDSRDDISYEQMVSILEELGFKVNGQQISWD